MRYYIVMFHNSLDIYILNLLPTLSLIDRVNKHTLLMDGAPRTLYLLALES